MSTTGIQLIVGLGNPGTEYETTRHNAGVWFVEQLANKAKATFKKEPKFQGLHCQANLDGHDVHLLIPTTYMNNSGSAVKALSNFYKIDSANILIAHDEIDLPVGDIRLKSGGGHGGHNGLRDIIQHFGTNHFYRLRIGVGRPGTGDEVVDYVLKPPKKAERLIIDESLRKADTIMPLVLAGQFQKAMHQLHTINKTTL